jgi:hypothetical protein
VTPFQWPALAPLLTTKILKYYPSPISRTLPDWIFYFDIGFVGGVVAGEEHETVRALLSEIYAAVRGGQHRLAAMGVRSLLEQVVIAKIGDHYSFNLNIDKFYEAGYIFLIQRDALLHLLEAGHAATHRPFAPSERDLTTLLDISEGILAAIYIHPDQAEALSKRVPPRARARPAKN